MKRIKFNSVLKKVKIFLCKATKSKPDRDAPGVKHKNEQGKNWACVKKTPMEMKMKKCKNHSQITKDKNVKRWT